MADDLAGIQSQFAVNDVTPRPTSGSTFSNMLVNSTGMGGHSNDPNVQPMNFGGTGEGAGNSYIQASQNLARVARETMMAGLAVEYATLVGRAMRGEYGSDDRARAGAETRMDEIAVQAGYGKGYRGEIKAK